MRLRAGSYVLVLAAALCAGFALDLFPTRRVIEVEGARRESDAHTRGSDGVESPPGTPTTSKPLPAAPVDGAGWSVFAAADGARTIYVSSSAGDDLRDGLTPRTAKRTIEAGYALLRDGAGDRLLLRRGDRWDENLGLLVKSGLSTESPLLITSYGDSGDPPLLRTGGRSAAWVFNQSSPPVVRHVAVVGIDFIAHSRDPREAGFTPPAEMTVGLFVLHRVQDFLVEGCRFAWYGQALALTGEGDGHENIRIRRCVVTDSYAVAGHAQGMFFSKIDGLLLQENILDHNGWNAGVEGAAPNIFRHGFYIYQDCSAVIVRGNIIARSASHGCQARTGGIVEDNLFIENAIGLYFTTGGSVRRNVVLDSSDIGPKDPRGIGFELRDIGEGGAVVSDNIIARTRSIDPRAGILLDSTRGTPIANVEIARNTVFDAGTALLIQGDEVQGVRLERNHFEQHVATAAPLVFATDAPHDGIQFAGNTYFSSAHDRKCFFAGGRPCTFAEWRDAFKDQGAAHAATRFVDAKRGIASYQASLGKDATTDAFYLELRKQSRHAWRREYTAAAINAYIHGGFALESGDRNR